MTFPHGETVTRLRAVASVDGYGNHVEDWSTPAELTLPGVGVAPRSTDEELIGRAATITGLTLYFKGGALPDVVPSDRMRVRGEVWEVDGDVADWVSPRDGHRRGVVVQLRRVEG